MSDDLKTIFWERMTHIRAGMLSPEGADPRPMAHTPRPDDHALWFITADGTDVADAAKAGKAARHIVASSGGHLYGWIDGILAAEENPEKLDDIWSPMAAAWFDEGREDEDICLVSFRPTKAELWSTDGMAKTLYEFSKAGLGGGKPDVGEHGVVTF